MEVKETEKQPPKIIKALRDKLNELAIDVPFDPDSSLSYPRKWLIRGESGKKRLLTQEPFTPISGEIGTHGVFLGDCLQCLTISHQRPFFYVFKRKNVAEEWLPFPSQEAKEQERKLISEKKIDTSSIAGGVEVSQQLFTTNNIYQRSRGICTTCHKLPLNKTEAIITKKGVFTAEEYASLPEEIKAKLHFIEI